MNILRKATTFVAIISISLTAVLFSSCEKEETIVQDEQVASEYEGLVNKKLLIDNYETVVELTLWAKNIDDLNDYINSREFTVEPIFSSKVSTSTTTSLVDEPMEDTSEFDAYSILMDTEVINLPDDAMGFSLNNKYSGSTHKKSSYNYKTYCKSPKRLTKGTVTHTDRGYTDDDVEVKWQRAACMMCAWFHGKTETIDDDTPTTTYSHGIYKIRAVVYHNYYNNFSVDFVSP